MKPEQENYQKMVAQDMSICGMMFRKRSHVSTKFTQRHPQQIPPSLRLAVEKMQVIEFSETWAKAWSAAARSAVTEAVDTEAAAAAFPAAEDVHSIGHVAPDRCVSFAGSGRRSAGGQLTPAIGLAKVAQAENWLEMAAQNPITILALQKTVVHLPEMFFLPRHRPFVIKMGWDSFSHETKPRETCITSMSAHFTGRA